MSCEELTAKIDAILEAALCACEGTDGGYTSSVTGPVYDDLEDDGRIKWEDQDPSPTPLEAEACALAQLVYAMNYEFLTEVLQPTQEALHEVLLFALFESLALMIGGPPALVPGAAVFYVVQAMLDAWVEAELANVLNALMANKNELICAMAAAFDGGGDYGDASAAARDVIDSVSAWTNIDKALFRLTFSPLVMKMCQVAYDAATAWAIANVTPGQCDDCGWWIRWTWAFPPCPGALVGDMPCSDGRPCFNAVPVATSAMGALPDILTDVDIHIEVEYKSVFNYGFTCGFVRIEYQDVATAWHALTELSCTTLEPAGTENYNEVTGEEVTIPRNVLRLQIHGMGGQGQEDPWPMMIRWIRVTIIPHV
ncbi:MAG: hypothetical protein V3W44_10415 [Dehalococcoidales bacterium]